MEKWKEIPNYPSYYISTQGRVKSVKFNKERIKSIPICDGRYSMVTLFRNGCRYVYSVHRLMANTFLGLDLDSKLVVHHINNISTDNRIENISVVSSSENHKTHNRGTSPTKGVGFCKRANKWLVRNKDRKFIGYYSSKAEAVSAINTIGWD